MKIYNRKLSKTYSIVDNFVELASSGDSVRKKLTLTFTSLESDEELNISTSSAALLQMKEGSGKTPIMTPRLASALDAAKVSNRQVSRIIRAVAHSLNVDLLNAVMSRSSIRWFRKKTFEAVAKSSKAKQPSYIKTVNWKGRS